MLTYDYFVLYFMTYAFLGWVWEFVFIYATEHWFHWHGFLRMPILPIYGFSAIGMILFVHPYVENPFLVFLASAALVTVMEFFTGLVLDKAFHMKLWTYDSWPLNVHGYVSLFSSMGFGVFGMALLYVIQPWVGSHIRSLPDNAVYIIGNTFTVLFVLDFANSLATVIRARVDERRDKPSQFDELQSQLADRIKRLTEDNSRRQAFLFRWYQNNLIHMRRGFPQARLSSEPKPVRADAGKSGAGLWG